MFRTLVLLLSSALLFGCATTQDIPREERSRTYEVPKNDLITAAVDAFTEEGYTIDSIDRETGLVITQAQSNSTLAAAFVGDKNRKLQAMVREQGSDRSRITLTLTLEQENAFGQTSSQSMTEEAAIDLYDEWFDRIEREFSRD